MQSDDNAEQNFDMVRIRDASPNPGASMTRKELWLNAYITLLNNHAPEEAAALADAALEIAIKRWENAPKLKMARFVIASDLAI